MADDKEKKSGFDPKAEVSVDPTVGKLLEKAVADGCETAFKRVAEGQKNRCNFGAEGICCRICSSFIVSPPSWMSGFQYALRVAL